LANGTWTLQRLVAVAQFVALLCAALLTAGARTARAGGVVGTGTPDSCTEAAFDAAAGGGGLVTFNCGGPATITFTSQKQVQNNSNITIDGGGVITISGGNSVNIAIVAGLATLTVQNLTVVDSNDPYYGAFWNHTGTLNVINCTFSGNHGAISTDANAVLTTVTNSTFSGNSGNHDGAIANDGSGPLTVTNSTFTGNSSGPAISNIGTLTITGSTFSGNSGGAISAGAGTLTVINSTFSGNTGTYSQAGAISNGGTLTVINCTFSGNTGYGSTHSSSLGNYVTLTLTNTIVANNTKGPNCSGTIIDGGHNIDDGTTCGFSTANASLNTTNPLLDPAGLASNGGPTQTIALQAGSPAIDAGDETVCSAPPVNDLDQRGYGRPGMGATNCAIGAYEYNAGSVLGPTATATPIPTANPTSTPTATGMPTPMPCVGDCHNDGHVTVEEILTMVNVALGNAELSECESGDANHDGKITIDEILTAVSNALTGRPSTPEQGCLGSGGTVMTALCCASTTDFPNTCSIGACGCSPDASHEVSVCECGAGTCFNGSACVSQ